MTAAFAAHSSLSDDQLMKIKFDQKLNSQVSPTLAFRDETGKPVTLGQYFGRRPVVLILGYYRCPMLCSLVLDGATASFRELRENVGEKFDVIFASIDPTEKPSLAAAKKAAYLREYGRRGSADGWHFLTGDTNSIRTLASEVGFRYVYDPALKQYAHPSGFVVLTPDGKVSHYFFGVTYSPREVDQALTEASAKKIGSPVEQFILLCCQYSPLHGRYGNLVMNVVRAGGIGTVLAMAFFFVRSQRNKPEEWR
ncbi:MAG TPA: SCO family protein [Verrucomicrobiae bacterium]|nr:SCO family protein [Verrucomicrobiae bacterium]